MTLCACMIQEGQIPEHQIGPLEEGLSEISSRYFAVPAETLWTAVDAGNGWTAGEPSTTSLVIMYVPAGIQQDERTSLLRSICDLWAAVTGCSMNEIVATARDMESQGA